MKVVEIEAKSILRKHKRIDPWFMSRYGMNLYRGCTHNCAYCDGRAEGYYVEGEFGEEITVKINALALLRRELDPARKRKPFAGGYIMAGGGVGDSYQQPEQDLKLTRGALELAYEFGHPVMMLTKSTLIERDLDLLKKIHQRNRVVVGMSFSSVDEKISRIFEPGVPQPEERLKTLRKFKEAGIPCGMFLMPLIPFLTDTREMITRTFTEAARAGLDFVIFGGMTLKEGRQKAYYIQRLEKYYPEVAGRYSEIYRYNRWGQASEEYYKSINSSMFAAARVYNLPVRMPYRLFDGMLNKNDLTAVLLDHIDFLLKLRGEQSPYGFVSYQVSLLKEPINDMKSRLRSIKGVGTGVEKVIREIIETGTAELYKSLIH
jgi:DNA repair photolyase